MDLEPDIDSLPDRPSAVDTVIGQIRDLIRRRGLAVGDVLPSETDLAGMFGAGRNTVREAVRTLKAYGIVESRQKVGAVITDRRQEAMTDLFSFAMDISADTFRDIQGFRRLTEMNLAPILVGKLPEETLRLLAETNERMAGRTDPAEASELDFRFHQIMVDAAGNRTLSEIYGMLKPVIRRLMEAGKTQRKALDGAVEEHAAILEALRSANQIDFLYHMNRHLDAGLEFIPDARAPRHTPAPPPIALEVLSSKAKP
jgi:GntR family transcriptional repressor for pyruvate dehydrogenase complex